MRKFLAVVIGIIIVTSDGCKRKENIVEFDPPEIIMTDGDSGSVERGQTFTINIELNAPGGMDYLTMNEEPVNGINSGETAQSIAIDLDIPATTDLGILNYEFVLMDQQGESTNSNYTLTIIRSGIVQSDSVSLYDNSLIIDETIEISSNDDQIEAGIFVFNTSEVEFEKGDVITGSQNGGYLRKVESVEIGDHQTVLTTSPAVITDLIKDSQIELEFGKLIENSNGRNLGETSFIEDFNNLKLLEENASSLTVNGYVELDARYSLNLDIENGILNSAEFSSSGTTLDLSLDTEILVSDHLEVANYAYEIVDVSKSFYSVSPPVFGEVRFKLTSMITSSVDASVKADISTRDKIQIDFSAIYQNGNWTNTLNAQEEISEGSADFSGIVNISNEIKLIPEIDIKLYGVSGPYFKPEAFATLDIGFASPSRDWDAFSEIGYGGYFGFKSEILGDLLNFEKAISEERFKVWNAPHAIEIVSGTNQKLYPNSTSEPIAISVMDNLGNPISQIPTYFTLNGQGELTSYKAFTNSSGNAETSYISNDNTGSYSIETSIKNRNEQTIDSRILEIVVDPLPDSLPIYEAAIVGSYAVTDHIENGGIQSISITMVANEDGTGYYDVVLNGQQLEPYNHYWYVTKINGKYHYRESGGWFNNNAQISSDITLPYNFLTLPVNIFSLYSSFHENGQSPWRTYSKK